MANPKLSTKHPIIIFVAFHHKPFLSQQMNLKICLSSTAVKNSKKTYASQPTTTITFYSHNKHNICITRGLTNNKSQGWDSHRMIIIKRPVIIFFDMPIGDLTEWLLRVRWYLYGEVSWLSLKIACSGEFLVLINRFLQISFEHN